MLRAQAPKAPCPLLGTAVAHRCLPLTHAPTRTHILRLPSLTPADVSVLAPALHAKGLYKKDIFAGFAAVIKVRV